jgi:hypothetical protein
MKKLLLINLLLCLGVFYSSAQTTITAAEYFFDTDPGVGNGIPVSLTAADTITTTLSFPTSSLSSGRHLFCFRTKDNLGKWGLATVTPFLLEPKGTQITKGEYFFDTDPGMGNGTAFTFTAADTIANNFSLPVTGLSNGRHLFCLRTKDNAGNWSHLSTALILAEPRGSQLIKGEYFLDTDPGMGNGTAFSFTAADTINNNFSLPVPSTSLGQHRLCLRMKDNAGNWGMTTCNLLQTVPPNNACTDAEYYYDTDPGVGNGSLLHLGLFQDTINLDNMAVPVPTSLTVGTHYLFIRSKNDGATFSLGIIDTFDVTAGALPVDLLSFTARKSNQQVLLNWRTAQETNNRGFEIQRSSDGTNFTAIGWVNGVGNSSSPKDYSFIDATPLKGGNFYRLKQIDIDNHSKLSDIRKVDFEQVIDFSVYPNPATTVLNVQLSSNIETIKISDMQGRLLIKENTNGSLQVLIPIQQLPDGIYILEVNDRNGNHRLQKFIKASH